jgi:hypothetical protein
VEEEEERGEGLVVSDGDSLREMGSPRTPVQRRKKQMVVLGLFSRFCLSVVLQVLVLSSKQINVACRGCVYDRFRVSFFPSHYRECTLTTTKRSVSTLQLLHAQRVTEGENRAGNEHHTSIGLATTVYIRIYTVYLVIFKPKIPDVHHIYMVLASPTHQ